VWCERELPDTRKQVGGGRGCQLISQQNRVKKLCRNGGGSRGWADFAAGSTGFCRWRPGAVPQPGPLFGGALVHGCVQQFGTRRDSLAGQDRRAETSDARQFSTLTVSRFHRPIMRLLHPNSLLVNVRRPFRLLTPFQNVTVAANCVPVGRASPVGLACQSRPCSSRVPGLPTAGPCSCTSTVGGRPFTSGGTLKKPQTQTEPSRPRPQGPGKDTQMGENAKDEAPFPLTDVDKWVLSLTDEEFAYHTWDELRQLIRTTTKTCSISVRSSSGSH
jgi:hypothetical protein